MFVRGRANGLSTVIRDEARDALLEEAAMYRNHWISMSKRLFALATAALAIDKEEETCSLESQMQQRKRSNANDCGDTSDPKALAECVHAALDAGEPFFYYEREAVCTTDDDGNKTCEPGGPDQPVVKYLYWNGADEKGGVLTWADSIGGVLLSECGAYGFAPSDGHVFCKISGSLQTACEKAD